MGTRQAPGGSRGAPGGPPEAPEGQSGQIYLKSVTKLALSSAREPPGGVPEASGALPVAMFTSFGTEQLYREREEGLFCPFLAGFRREIA